MADLSTTKSRTDVYRACLCQTWRLKETDGNAKAKPVPGQLLIAPGIYEINNRCYRMEQGGLYRWICDGGAQQRLLWDGNTLHLLSGIAWLHAHGNIDNQLDFQALYQTAQMRKLILTCGYISNFAVNILNAVGIRSHILTALSLHYDPLFGLSHNMIELQNPANHKWLLCDLTFKCIFL